MSVQESTKVIESQDFSALLGMANNSKMFRELMEQQKSVQQLLESVKTPENAKDLLARIDSLVRAQDDIRYRNTRDAALAVYMWTLNEANPALARLAASFVLSMPRLWWARQMAATIFGITSTWARPSAAAEAITSSGTLNVDLSSLGRDAVILADVDRDLVRSAAVIDPTSADTKSMPESTEVVSVGDVEVSNPSASAGTT